MGLFSKLGKGLKKVGKAIGKGWEKIDDFALPAVGFALGGPAGAALGSAAARGIGDGKFDLKATALAGAKGYGMGALGSAAGLTGGSGVKALLGSGKAAIGGAISNPVATAGNLMQSQVPGAGGGGGGFLDSLGGVQGAMDLGLGGLSAYQGYQAQKKGEKLSNEALALQRARDAELTPMRQAGIQRLMSAQRPDLSSDFASSNPFARPLKRIG